MNGGLKNWSNFRSSKAIFEDILNDAAKLNVTDIHIQPIEEGHLIKFRIFGKLKTIGEIKANYSKLSRYIKAFSGLNFSEKTFPQQGYAKFENHNLRISVSPVFLGEKITIRLIRLNKKVRSLTEIGVWGNNLKKINQALTKERGIIFTVGQGKNTTNFALLEKLSNLEKSIITIEKNIEKTISGISQTSINPKVSLDYFTRLKAALNHNPDIIMIDNISDKKTAELAFEASMSGKLIIASLPVSKSTEAIPFLRFLGVENFLISTNTLAIIGQNLVRTIKPENAKFEKLTHPESETILKEFRTNGKYLNFMEKSARNHFSLSRKTNTSAENIISIAKTSDEYIGSTGIFEVISFLDKKIGKDLISFISINPNIAEIEEFLVENEFEFLETDGLIKSLCGITTFEELIRKVGY